MIPNWTNHLKDQEEITRFKRHLLNSKSILERQTQIMDEMERELDRSETGEAQYDSPSWAALQADRNGYRRALRRIKQLNVLDQKEPNESLR